MSKCVTHMLHGTVVGRCYWDCNNVQGHELYRTYLKSSVFLHWGGSLQMGEGCVIQGFMVLVFFPNQATEALYSPRLPLWKAPHNGALSVWTLQGELLTERERDRERVREREKGRERKRGREREREKEGERERERKRECGWGQRVRERTWKTQSKVFLL